MELIEVIKKRRSVRRFKPDSVPQDLIRQLIESAVWAPSACNLQGWRFIVVDDQKIKDEIVDQGGAITIKTAPAGILVVYDNRTRNFEYQDYIQSGAAAVQNLLLMAASLGLGSCWICHLPSKARLRKIFKIPNSFSPIAYIALGYPEKEQPEVARMHPIESLIGYNKLNPAALQVKVSNAKLFLFRILVRIYYILPTFLKKGLINKLVDQKFVKKFND